MKLLVLRLTNFQGFRDAVFEFNGRSASLYGDNATGKTTIFNAFTWLLFDKPSTGAKNFSPKTKGPEGDLHYLEHGAEAHFQTETGRIVTFSKTYHEVYKKKRGSASEEFDGHTVEYSVDGVPCSSEKEYINTVISFCGNQETMKMLTMPDYFSEVLSWDTRRKILLDICGDISDEDIISGNSELIDLSKILRMPGTANQFYTVDEYRKIAGAKKAEINRQISDIPGRIDEAQRAVPDILGLDKDIIECNITGFNAQKEKLLGDKAAAASGGTASSEIRKAIADLEAKMAEARAEHIRKNADVNSDTETEISKARYEASSAHREATDLEQQRIKILWKREETANIRKKLLDDYAAVNKETWDDGQAICPTCHRELPADQVERMREDFNLSKSGKLEEINQRGQRECSAAIIEGLTKEMDDLQDRISAAKKKEQDATDRIADLNDKIVATVKFEDTAEYAEIAAKIAAYRAMLEDEGKTTADAVAAIEAHIQTINAQIRDEQDKLMKLTMAQTQSRRIEELNQQEKRLAEEFEELEKGLYLCDVFIKTKVSALTERINGKFRSVRFRLFQEQLNGGVKEDCEVMIPTDDGRMVPYAFANNAARINAGLEIISTLSNHFNVRLPVFVDNAESVTHLENVDTQVIRLVVSEPDKQLRLEVQ